MYMIDGKRNMVTMMVDIGLSTGMTVTNYNYNTQVSNEISPKTNTCQISKISGLKPTANLNNYLMTVFDPTKNSYCTYGGLQTDPVGDLNNYHLFVVRSPN